VYKTTPFANTGTDVYNIGSSIAAVHGFEMFANPPKYQE
jgi:hypothetical protein